VTSGRSQKSDQEAVSRCAERKRLEESSVATQTNAARPSVGSGRFDSRGIAVQRLCADMLPGLFAVHGFGHAQPMFVRKGTDRVLTQSPCQTAFIIDVALQPVGSDGRRKAIPKEICGL